MTRCTSALTVVFVFALAACGGSVGSDQGAGAQAGTNAMGGHPGVGGSGAGGGGGFAAGGAGGIVGSGGFSTGGVGTGGGVSADFSGVWSGYVENYKFEDGTDTVVMTLDTTQAGVSGHVDFGNAPPIPPPTNPDVGYPPGDPQGWGGGANQSVRSGFDYTIFAGSFDGERLQFQIAPLELYKPWCEMQTPIADDNNPGMYHCVHNWGGGGDSSGNCFQTDPQTGQNIPIDCGKMMLCQMTCSCNASGCTVDLNGGPSFDMQLKPPTADGSVAGLDGSVHNVHLKKQ